MCMFASQQGFTLVEMVIAVAILVVVMTVACSVFDAGLKFWDKGNRELDLRQNLRIAMEKIVWEVRQGTDLTIVASPWQGIMFDYRGERIRYRFDPTDQEIERAKLVNGSWEGNNPIAQSITNLSFHWGDQAKQRLIINIVASDGKTTETLRTAVAPRYQ